MPEDTHYTIAQVECGNCFQVTKDHVVRKGTTVHESKCPECGCTEVLWPKRQPAAGAEPL